MEKYTHLTVHARWGQIPLKLRGHCADLWHRLQEEFPVCLGCALMPNHAHLGLLTEDPTADRLRLSKVLSGHSRRYFPGKQVWSPIEINPISDVKMLFRVTRYIQLNPCRDRLTDDPVRWEWTTHRDLVGAVSDPWLDLPRLQRLWGATGERFRREFHRYVSDDSSVKIGGTPVPVAAKSSIIAPMDRIRDAVLAAERARELGVDSRRRVALLAERMGSPDREELARALDCSRWTVQRDLRTPVNQRDEDCLRAATRILSDPRLWPPENLLRIGAK